MQYVSSIQFGSQHHVSPRSNSKDSGPSINDVMFEGREAQAPQSSGASLVCYIE